MSLDIVLYRPSWQKLRVSCLSAYNPYGGLSTAEGAIEAVTRLRNYVSDADPNNTAPQYVTDEMTPLGVSLSVEYATRIYRVENLIQATINGLVSQPNVHHLEGVVKFRQELKLLLNNSDVTKYANAFDWQVVTDELLRMSMYDNYWFNSIRLDMEERIKEKSAKSEQFLYFYNIVENIQRR